MMAMNKSEWLFLDTRKINTSNLSSLYKSSKHAIKLYEKCTTQFCIQKSETNKNAYEIVSKSIISPNEKKQLSFYQELFSTITIIVFWMVYLSCVVIIILLLFTFFTQSYSVCIIFIILYIASISIKHKRLDYIFHNKFMYATWDYFSFTYCYNKQTLEYIKNSYMKQNKRNLLILTVPHAVIPMSCRLALPLLEPIYGINFIPTQADVIYHLPVLRTFSMWLGIQSVSKKSIIEWLSKNKIVEIIADGIAGIFARPSAFQNDNIEYIVMKNHKGIAKLALQTESDVIIGYGFGDTLMFNVLYDNMGLMRWISRKMKTAFFLFYGRYYIPFVFPYRQPLYYVLGQIVRNHNRKIANPSQAQIDAYHDMLLNGIKTLFDQHKGIYGWKDKEIVFV
eukprot:436026_1